MYLICENLYFVFVCVCVCFENVLTNRGSMIIVLAVNGLNCLYSDRQTADHSIAACVCA